MSQNQDQNQLQETSSPPQSLPSSPATSTTNNSHRKPRLSLDLSALPPLTRPTPPTNTLLITDLQDLYLFQPPSLATIRSQINATAPLNSFSPLPSFRRIVCSFYTPNDAIRIRELLNGQSLLDRRVRTRIYFGEPTPILDDEESRPKLLQAPHLDKLFFISPPPSPPHGWEMRPEDPPNKEVHADDLAQALANLKTRTDDGFAAGTATGSGVASCSSSSESPVGGPCGEAGEPATPASVNERNRSRSSTVIYHPNVHGDSPALPAVTVEDTSLPIRLEFSEMDISPIEIGGSGGGNKQAPFKTSRPPLELME